MASRRDTLLAEIAQLKEERNEVILEHAPEDDAAAGQGHPDVRAIEARIVELRAEVKALDEEE